MVEFSIYMKPIPYFSLQVDFRLIITAHCKSLKSIMVINACSLIRNLRKVAMYLKHQVLVHELYVCVYFIY